MSLPNEVLIDKLVHNRSLRISFYTSFWGIVITRKNAERNITSAKKNEQKTTITPLWRMSELWARIKGLLCRRSHFLLFSPLFVLSASRSFGTAQRQCPPHHLRQDMRTFISTATKAPNTMTEDLKISSKSDRFLDHSIHLKQRLSPLPGMGMNDVVHLSRNEVISVPCLPFTDTERPLMETSSKNGSNVIEKTEHIIQLIQRLSPLSGMGMNDVVHLSGDEVISVPCLPFKGEDDSQEKPEGQECSQSILSKVMDGHNQNNPRLP